MVFTLQQNRYIYYTMRIGAMACETLKELNNQLKSGVKYFALNFTASNWWQEIRMLIDLSHIPLWIVLLHSYAYFWITGTTEINYGLNPKHLEEWEKCSARYILYWDHVAFMHHHMNLIFVEKGVNLGGYYLLSPFLHWYFLYLEKSRPASSREFLTESGVVWYYPWTFCRLFVLFFLLCLIIMEYEWVWENLVCIWQVG